MKDKEYCINLNHLTAGERFGYPDTFKEYSKAVVSLLSIKNDFLFEDDLIKEYKDDDDVQRHIKNGEKEMAAIVITFPDKFVGAGKRRRNKDQKEFTPVWFDIWKDYDITPDDFHYDLFFTYRLRQTDLLEMDALLNHFLENYYEDNKTDFIRFLKLTLRKHCKKLLQTEQTETINEWIVEKEKEATLSGTPDAKIKGKIKRSRDDNVTKLNQEQTTLLIHYLKAGKIILKEEYLNDKEAGQAFSILTGYSADSLRQNLSEAEIKRISIKKNIDAVANALMSIQLLIPKEIKDKK